MIFYPVRLLRSLLFVIFLCVFSFLSVPQFQTWAEQNQQLGLTDSEFKKLIDTANKKAKELGYKIEELEFSLSKDGKLCVAQYGSKHITKRKL